MLYILSWYFLLSNIFADDNIYRDRLSMSLLSVPTNICKRFMSVEDAEHEQNSNILHHVPGIVNNTTILFIIIYYIYMIYY